MSMMMRRTATGRIQSQEQDAGSALDPRFPEATGVTPLELATPELYPHVARLTEQRFSGYLHIVPGNAPAEADGVVLLCEGAPIGARTAVDAGADALTRILSQRGAPTVLCTAHPLSRETALALAATFHPPQLTQPMGNDSGEVALLLRELTGVRHSGIIHLGARGAHPAIALWARILLHEGKILGVYSAHDRHPKASLAEVTAVLTAPLPQLSLFALPPTVTPLALPPRAAGVPAAARVSGATPARDETLETDLVWFLSRFERAFGRLKERREPHADLLRAFGELTNELASFVAPLQGRTATPAAAHAVVAAELRRVRADGIAMQTIKPGKAGLDAAAIARGYGACTRRSPQAAAYFAATSADLLTLIGRLLERMLGAFYDPVAGGLAREAGETLLREVREGLSNIP